MWMSGVVLEEKRRKGRHSSLTRQKNKPREEAEKAIWSHDNDLETLPIHGASTHRRNWGRGRCTGLDRGEYLQGRRGDQGEVVDDHVEVKAGCFIYGLPCSAWCIRWFCYKKKSFWGDRRDFTEKIMSTQKRYFRRYVYWVSTMKTTWLSAPAANTYSYWSRDDLQTLGYGFGQMLVRDLTCEKQWNFTVVSQRVTIGLQRQLYKI